MTGAAGGRVPRDLREGAARAVETLGTGLLAHPRNDDLRRRLATGALSPQEYHRHLIRVVCRLLVLFVAEDRSLLHAHEAGDRHDPGFPIRHLRERAMATSRRTTAGESLWSMLSDVARALGHPHDEEAPACRGSFVRNDDVLDAIRAVSFIEIDATVREVEFRRLGAADLGAAYESLLAMRAAVDPEARSFALRPAVASARKTTGSYYTPEPLVHALLDAVLEPVVDGRLEGLESPRAQENAILELRICDPAAGAGHFLVAAARRLARRLTRVRLGGTGGSSGYGRPESTHDLRSQALRDVIDHCLYGVDLDPMAAELCRFALWIESTVPGRPLSFLDHRIRVADALLDRECFPEVFGAASAGARSGFDVVVGNPPWMSYTGRQKVAIPEDHLARLVERFPAIRRWPCSHAAFALLQAELLREGGRSGLVLPRQIADLDSFGPVRAAVSRVCRLVGPVRDVGEDAFDGVTQPAGLYCMECGPARPRATGAPWPVAAAETDGTMRVGAKPGARPSPDLRAIIARCRTLPAFPPGTFGDPGVHTGNVSGKIVLEERPRAVPPFGRFEPVREGRDIVAFRAGPPRKWLWVDARLDAGEYCRLRDVARYTGTPIILRQTASRPIAARHAAPAYFRNSLLACYGVAGVADSVVLGLLNSTLYAFLHRARFFDAGQKAFPQVKVKHLHALPGVPDAAVAPETARCLDELDAIVRRIEAGAAADGAADDLRDELDRCALRAFGLDPGVLPALREALE